MPDPRWERAITWRATGAAGIDWKTEVLMLRSVVVILALALAGGFSTPAAADVEQRLADLGIELPEVPQPIANYVRAVSTGNLVFLSGHGPLKPEGGYVTGKVGSDLTVEEGYAAARLTGLALLASLKREIGDLDRVQKVVRVFGMVNTASRY